jgi:hypothetical protein|tara:strand:+ start:460 stop:630 length:171 start_codon:yes stop_codon:yes gene_type:complete
MVLADRLKKSVEEILQMTTLEIELWAGYMLYEHKERKRTMGKQQMTTPHSPRGKHR